MLIHLSLFKNTENSIQQVKKEKILSSLKGLSEEKLCQAGESSREVAIAILTSSYSARLGGYYENELEKIYEREMHEPEMALKRIAFNNGSYLHRVGMAFREAGIILLQGDLKKLLSEEQKISLESRLKILKEREEKDMEEIRLQEKELFNNWNNLSCIL